MDETLVKILFRDGHEEDIDCCAYRIKDGVLELCKRYDRTICYPLDTISKYEILD